MLLLLVAWSIRGKLFMGMKHASFGHVLLVDVGFSLILRVPTLLIVAQSPRARVSYPPVQGGFKGRRGNTWLLRTSREI